MLLSIGGTQPVLSGTGLRAGHFAKPRPVVGPGKGTGPGPGVVVGLDAANHLTSLSRTIGGSGTAVNTTLSYDNANRLTSEQNAEETVAVNASRRAASQKLTLHRDGVPIDAVSSCICHSARHRSHGQKEVSARSVGQGVRWTPTDVRGTHDVSHFPLRHGTICVRTPVQPAPRSLRTAFPCRCTVDHHRSISGRAVATPSSTRRNQGFPTVVHRSSAGASMLRR
jgi:hypothetical protein